MRPSTSESCDSVDPVIYRTRPMPTMDESIMPTSLGDGTERRGQVITGLRRLRPEVLATREVQFALEAYSVYRAGNWTAFFALAKGAPYVASCLMHAFFNKLRSRALKVLHSTVSLSPSSATTGQLHSHLAAWVGHVDARKLFLARALSEHPRRPCWRGRNLPLE